MNCLCLTGPTACGKTELALELAKRFPVEIISMDSAQVYRGMDIGTAKPPLEVRENVPHHLIDIADPAEAYSAGRFVADARAAACAITKRGAVPLLVGGTLLYLRAFRNGLAILPGANSAVRQRLDSEALESGWPALHERLASIDPDAATRIAPTDRQRIQRALEVFELTGEAISTLQRRVEKRDPPLSVAALAVVDDDRAKLGARIERRFDSMLAAGLIAEIEGLRARGDLRPELPAMRAVGYRQIWKFLSGDSTLEEARRRAIVATRQLAKRQMTWIRADANLHTLPWSYPAVTQAVVDWARAAGAERN